MKRMQLLILALLASLVMFQGAAFAKSVTGAVVSTDAVANSLTISQKNPDTGADEEVTVWVKDETTYTGAESLAGLKEGDEVTVEAEEDAATMNWMATSVEVAQAQVPAPVTPATT